MTTLIDFIRGVPGWVLTHQALCLILTGGGGALALSARIHIAAWRKR